MEKLIHILPNLISNADTTWLKEAVRNPDTLTKDIMERFDFPVYYFSIGFRSEIEKDSTNNKYLYRYDDLLKNVSDRSSVDELIYALNTSRKLEHGKELASLLTELKGDFDLKGKSATSVIWTAAIVNSIQNKGVDHETIREAFFVVSSTLDSKNGKTIGNLHNEVRSILAQDNALYQEADDYLVTAFVTNQEVKNTKNWYDFRTLEKFDMHPTTEINSDADLFLALKDINNYNNALNYIIKTYLSETDPIKDGYCQDESEQMYKAFNILASLAHELYKDDPEFDKDNNIGLNLTTEILAYQDAYNSGHLFAPLTNGLNTYEDAAGRIVDKLLGRVSVKIPGSTTKFSRAIFKYGNMEEYIKANIASFEKGIKPHLSYCRDLIAVLTSIYNRHYEPRYKGDKTVQESLAFISRELGVELVKDEKKTPKENLYNNLDNLLLAANERYNMINSIGVIFKKLKVGNKTNLNIDEVGIANFLGRDIVIHRPEHLKILRQFYDAIASDPILVDPALKSDPNLRLRIKSPEQILAGIKSRVEKNKDAYPELAKFLGTFRLSPKEQIIDIVGDRYAEATSETFHKEFADVYDALTSKVDNGEKLKAVKESSLSDEEKSTIETLLNKGEKDQEKDI